MATSKMTPQILELFGAANQDPTAALRARTSLCPFRNEQCSHLVKGFTGPSGICSVSHGATKKPVIVCRNRFYGDDHATLRMAAIEAFGAIEIIMGGEDNDDLLDRLLTHKGPAVVGFGEGSGKPVQIGGRAKLSFDWIFQSYTARRKRLGFIAIDVQAMELGGNYLDSLEAWHQLMFGNPADIPPSGHTLNWPDIEKKLIPNMVRKALILQETPGCTGNFVLMPEPIFTALEASLGPMDDQETIGADIISIRVYAPDGGTRSGVRSIRGVNYRINDLVVAHYGQAEEGAATKLASVLKGMLSS